MSGARRVGRGLAALATLVGVLFGVPFGLARFGQPPPGGVPSWRTFTTGLSHRISDSTLLRSAGLLCWLVWALFAVAVALEIAGQVAGWGRRRPPGRSPRLAVPGLQGWARTLVLSAALLLPSRGVAGSSAGPVPVAPVAPVVAIVAGPATPPTAGAPAVAGPGAVGVPVPSARVPSARVPVARVPVARGRAVRSHRYVVRRYDSLWSIADRHLGSGTRWREIRDEKGRRLADEGSEARIIRPGQVLLLPEGRPDGAEAVVAPPRARSNGNAVRGIGTAGTAGARAPSPRPVSSEPRPAAPPLGIGRGPGTGPSVAPAPPIPAPAIGVGSSAPGGSPRDASPVPAPTATQPPPTMVAMAAAHGSTTGRAVGGALFEAGLAGAAALGVLRALRRRQARLRPAGRRIRLPGPPLANAEMALLRHETPERMPLLERALDCLTETLRQRGTPPPEILGALVDDESVEVLLAHPAPPPPPWIPSAEGFRWRLLRSRLPEVGSPGSPALPALAALGRVAAGSADALINLEAAGVLAVTGDPSRAASLVYAVATHLIGAPWTRATTLIVTGLPAALALPDNARHVDSLADVADELRTTAEVMTATARQHGCADLFSGRVGGVAGDGWPPVVVVAGRALRVEEARLLGEVARPGQGVAAVVVDPGSAANWRIDVDSRPCPVSPLRLAIEPSVLDPSTMAAIADLLAIAEDAAGCGLEDPPYDRIELSVARPGPAQPAPQPAAQLAPQPASQAAARPAPAPAPRPASQTLPAEPSETGLTVRLARLHEAGSLGDLGNRGQGGAPNGRHDHAPAATSADGDGPDLGHPAILVRVLGSVEIDGAGDFKRAKSRELVVYLAMHPNGVGESELDEALWASSGARVVVASTRDATVSVARTALGGPARLLPAQGQGREKRYQLGPDVESDWSQFCVLHRFGRDHRSAQALRQALDLVRGRPFEAVVSGRTYGWIHTEGHGRHIEAEVADAADLAAGLFLDGSDPRAARWAARRGLLAEPYTERLWVRLMEAADALGESQEIERIMDEMDVVLELEGDFSGLHPNTLAVYDRLSRRHRFPVDRVDR